MRTDDPAWQFFAALQDEADPKSIDRSLASAEALDAVLKEIVSDPMTDQDLLRKKFNSLCRNRLSKQNNRRAVDRRRFRTTHRRAGVDYGSLLLTAPEPTAFRDLAYAQLTDLIRKILPEEEFGLLVEIAEGGSYCELAHSHNTTVSGVKSKLFRIRTKLRNSPISPVLRFGLRRGEQMPRSAGTASGLREVVKFETSGALKLAGDGGAMYASRLNFTARGSQR